MEIGFQYNQRKKESYEAMVQNDLAEIITVTLSC